LSARQKELLAEQLPKLELTLEPGRDPRTYFDTPVKDVWLEIGFGAGGPHFCLGANLARREIAVMFDEIRRRLPYLHITGEPAYLRSNFINGIKRMQCAW